MSSNDDFTQPSEAGDAGFDGTRTPNPPWPHLSPQAQTAIEKKFFEDGATIRFDTLPKLQFWAPMLGYPHALGTAMVIRKVTQQSMSAQRRLTANEVDVVALYAANSNRQFAWAQPVSVAMAAGVAWKNRATFKFPFYQPKMTSFDPYMFPHRSMPFLKGMRAAAIWHVIRFVTYCPLCWVPAAIFFNSQADMSFGAHMQRDPRVSHLVQDIKRNIANTSAKLREAQSRRTGIPERPGQPQSPIAPSPGSDAYAEQGENSNGSTSTGAYTSQRAQQPSWAPSAAPRAPRSQPQAANYGSRDDSDDTGLFDDDHDDASPVSQASKQAQNSQVGSWDRIRQQSRSGAAKWEQGDSSGQEKGWAQLRQDKTQDTREATPKTEGFAYSKEDEEREKRKYDKERAQQEFDALVEAERRGESSDRNWRR